MLLTKRLAYIAARFEKKNKLCGILVTRPERG